MKFKLYMLFLLFFGPKVIFSQTLVNSGELGSFTSAQSFSINSAGIIYVTDISNNEVIKIDTLGKILKFIGGYGWSPSLFDAPVDVFATTLNVYVSDKNNNRIQFFDKDLNFISEFSTQNTTDDRIVFRYPVCSAVSNQGDLFILDSDNKRVIKFNLRGEYHASIGSFDSGLYALDNPTHLILTSNTKLLVIDSPNLVLFDQFGNGIKKIPLPFQPNNINNSFQTVCISNAKQVALFNDGSLEKGNLSPVVFTPKLDEDILDACVFNSKLYVLVKNTIMVYKIDYAK
jgi:hypothetical protein